MTQFVEKYKDTQNNDKRKYVCAHDKTVPVLKLLVPLQSELNDDYSFLPCELRAMNYELVIISSAISLAH